MGHTKETTGLGPIISPESVSTLVHAALLRRFTSGIRISSSPPPSGARPGGESVDRVRSAVVRGAYVPTEPTMQPRAPRRERKLTSPPARNRKTLTPHTDTHVRCVRGSRREGSVDGVGEPPLTDRTSVS